MITCNLVISSFLSELFFCFLLVTDVSTESHLGHLSWSHVNVRGHFPGNWSVSAASYLDTTSRMLESGILQFPCRYSAVLLRYFCDKPQSSLCCSQSSSWKTQCHKFEITPIFWTKKGYLRGKGPLKKILMKSSYLCYLGVSECYDMPARTHFGRTNNTTIFLLR